ncbi:FMN-binding negative transcriptional regulator [Mucilaginibacter sp. RS28]|uniref:FMN-binding negative transcriptional regulator n=1 Tax=Mucilaginibacter straminoryzae TaxID=2932774 RepID=A0A9X2BAM5_9SPHI|nr:FMN-binding negative transcriptional regulator [Mucilaginibacter straminoryzae]MCJ8211561.1 FMN-binding negative transcriptional regulator [Mucilaginibacter straminoryzae]
MYVTKPFHFSSDLEAVEFIKRYSFGALVTVEAGLPVATHIPFSIHTEGEKLVLSSHIALANNQSATLTTGKALVIFTEPHAYISPAHYEKELSVPTWNYIAVHAYGEVTLITDDEGKLKSLEEMILTYDTNYFKQWKNLPQDWKLKMIKGITAFEVTVTDLQGKKKLSQNRTDVERANIINSFAKSTDQNERDIAEYMRTTH